MPGGDGCGLCHSGLTGDGMMFDSRNIPDDLMTNGQYYAFQKLGEYYNMGNTLMVIYAIGEIPWDK
ncbi:putative amino acid permease [Escherichia coli]|uniref:Putative amino acid permease n=1 Tax=Escherichia coli TaxID=562 RepID=A0A376TJ82_ECOLX|nr:putative amino acid permease [Escherichia coli]